MTQDPGSAAPRRRLRACVEAWPECSTGDYDPKCCRFPKSCSCDIYDEEYVPEGDLEPGLMDGAAACQPARWARSG